VPTGFPAEFGLTLLDLAAAGLPVAQVSCGLEIGAQREFGEARPWTMSAAASAAETVSERGRPPASEEP
jgi:hypothetical protein